MLTFMPNARSALRVLLLLVTSVSAFSAGELHVIASGTLVETFSELIPAFERDTHNKVVVAFGASVASAPGSVHKRIERGDRADVIILAVDGLNRLTEEGRIVRSTQVDIARSRIGVAVRTGVPKPDISSVDALRRTLLAAPSIAYSSSLSGVYVSKELFPRLGIAEAIQSKMKRVDGRVGDAIARGEAEIGFQQISELLPVRGIQYAGPLPAAVQRTTTMSAGIAANASNPEAGQALIRFLTSRRAAALLRKHGLEPAR
ncbi:MAG: ABC transporter substrate-binding protein [Acidobacteria bacterium]|nr:ABC transporter substrate-binding protein [Acidobacteriota bacterium]